MKRFLSLFIGLRYLRAKKRNHFISFISGASFIGIALGVAVLITVLSVMNGFDREIRERMLVMVPQASVSGWNGQLDDWQKVYKQLEGKDQIIGMAPYIQGQAMITREGFSAFGILMGVDPKLENTVSPINSKMTQGDLANLKAGEFGVILGKDLANSLGATIGSKVTLVVPKASFSPVGFLPRLKQFKVVGIFSVGYQFDSSYALLNIHDAAKLLQMDGKVSGLQLKFPSAFDAPNATKRLNNMLLPAYQAIDWTQQNTNFFKALQMEKTMMFFILVLIITVAAFNMLASLVMVVTDKQSDIAILRTLGASSRQVMSIFIVQGTIIGMIGIIIGIVLGIILAMNTTEIVNWIQTVFHVQFLSANVYYIDFLPSQLELKDVINISIVAFILSFLATLYPAWRAAKIQPAEALRYE
ncbi:lipoprotein-releasing ABC transporter permease subunit [Thiotrichales bacterium 19S11-10]|nr:lipoprotein-releasing ABC transporter permease subunit [Thiotrichales bacterium 19S11-10]MCF6808346.1 lipoprotein-releasing ABC transporter permease subunit [Thiotrichales bacterium 19S9-11]MCF6811811.1 lipoprotein-releasing ABC transporter permease subunit [Thiotrichales bacterium 19S9-12]